MSDEKNPAGENPGGEPPLDVDSVFAAIVADWSRELPETERSWPASEDAGPSLRQDDGDITGLDDTSRGGSGYTPDGDLVGATRGPLLPEGAREPSGEDDAPAREEEGYTPPEPPPLPRTDLIGTAAWIGALGGPLFLLISVIAWRSAPQLLLMLAIVAFVGGFVTLVARMPQHRDDDGDDGAVV